MNFEDLLGIALTLIVFGVPALALSVRLVVKPLTEAVAELRESLGGESVDRDVVLSRLGRVETELAQFSSRLERLEGERDFHAEVEVDEAVDDLDSLPRDDSEGGG